MKFEEYRDSGYEEYLALSREVRRILELVIEQTEKEFQLQPIQNRAKAPLSLKKKLESRGLIGTDQIEEEVKDLAGCRLVFYTNNDVNRFLNSRIVIDNFEVVWDKSKFHEPVKNSDERYIAMHYTVRLLPARLELPEYSRYQGMLCEIQVQTILNHAWSETTHDILYKRPTLDGFGTTEFQSIGRRLNEIMTKYLQPAGYEFQKVQLDFERLLTGKRLFESDALETLDRCDDNNTRYELLEQFRDYVLPHYDDIVAAYPNIRQQLISAIMAARPTPTKSVETPFGSLPGRDHVAITDVALDILERLRYIDIDESLSALCDIYATSPSEEESNRIVKAVEKLSGHNLAVWKKYGPIVQVRIVRKIESLEPGLMSRVVPLVGAALGQVLSPDAKSTTSTADAMTFHRAAVLPSPELKELRDAALTVLLDLYKVRDASDRRMLLNAIWQGLHSPQHGPSSDDLDVIILEDARRVVEFFVGVIANENFERIQHLEHKIFWMKKHFGPWAAETKEHSARAAAAVALLESIERFRNVANSDQEFVIYKILVGYESVFPDAWEEQEFDLREERAYRTEKIAELVDSIDAQNSDEWKRRIARCAETESSDGATFIYFGKFLFRLGGKQPAMALEILNAMDESWIRFLPSIFSGLQDAGSGADAAVVLTRWIHQECYLEDISRAIRCAADLDLGLLEAVAEAAFASTNRLAVLHVTATVIERYSLDAAEIQKTLFIRCVDWLTRIEDASWVRTASIHAKESRLFGQLDATDVDHVLGNLLLLHSLEYDAELVLARLMEGHPEAVIEFFGGRVRRGRGLQEKDGYEAIPFDFHELAEPLQNYPGSLVTLGETLFFEDDYLFEFGGGRLLAIVFPTIAREFEGKLIECVRSGDRKKIEFVLKILRNYEGETFLHEICKEVVNALEPEDELLNRLSIVLDSTGTVTGNFGVRDAYVQKKVEMQPWLEDEREGVRAFAERHCLGLDRQIAAEQRRAQEDIEMRRREYGEEQ